MRVKMFELMEDMIEDGLRGGLLKAQKWEHVHIKDFEAAVSVLKQYVELDLCRYLDFDDTDRQAD